MNIHIQSLDLYFDLISLQINTAYTVTGPKVESKGPAPSMKKQNFLEGNSTQNK
jgi:hypothetical protein